MSLILLAVVGAYSMYAIVMLWKRPGFMAAMMQCSYGLAVFFAPIGTIASIVSMVAVAGARLAGVEQSRGILSNEVPLALFTVMMLGSLVLSPHIDIAGHYASLFVGLALTSYFFARSFSNHSTFVRDLYWGSMIITSTTFIQLIRSSEKLGRLGANGDSGLNAVGLAGLCELGLIPGLSILLFDKSASLQSKMIIVLFIVLIAIPFLISTGTRSALLSTGIVFITFSVIYMYYSSMKARLYFAGMIFFGAPALLILLALLASPKLLILIAQGALRFVGYGRHGFTGGRSTDQRLDAYGQALDIFKESPVIGHGLGSFGFLADGTAGVYPHNIELELLVSSGIFGIVLFALFLAPVFFSAAREFVRRPPRWDRIAIGGLLISTFIRHQVSSSFASGKILFMVAGCFVAWALSERAASRAKTAGDEPDGQPAHPTGAAPVA